MKMSNKIPDFLRLRVQPWGLLMVAGVIACIATVFGFLGRFSWFLDLFSHFRVQYLLGLGVIGLIFLAARRRDVSRRVLSLHVVASRPHVARLRDKIGRAHV